VDLREQGDRVEGAILRLEGGGLVWGQEVGSPETLVRGAGGVVAFADAPPDPLVGDDLADRLEEVEVGAEEGVYGGELDGSGLGGEAAVADDAADRGPVALLDPGLIVLAVGATPGGADAASATVGLDEGVEELAAVVGV
jgi:hypothetical protein